jgi:hypothetical protein
LIRNSKRASVLESTSNNGRSVRIVDANTPASA